MYMVRSFVILITMNRRRRQLVRPSVVLLRRDSCVYVSLSLSLIISHLLRKKIQPNPKNTSQI